MDGDDCDVEMENDTDSLVTTEKEVLDITIVQEYGACIYKS